jgi:hypothetical protein
VEDDCDSWKERLKVDTVRLSQFLLSAGQVCRIYLRLQVLMTQTIKFSVLWVTVYQTTRRHIPEDGSLFKVNST